MTPGAVTTLRLWRRALYWFLRRRLLRWLLRRRLLHRFLWFLRRDRLRRFLRRNRLRLLLRRDRLRRFLRRGGQGLLHSAVQSDADLGVVTKHTPAKLPISAEQHGKRDASGRQATQELIDRMLAEDDLVIHSISFHKI